VVECVHLAEGCLYTCQRHHLAHHLLDSCPYREVQEQDQEFILSKEPSSHTPENHSNDDPEEHMQKVNIIKLVVLFSYYIILTTCSQSRNSIKSLSVSSAQVTSQAHYSASRSTADTTPSPSFAALAEQNIILRKRVEGLEGTLHGFKREMIAMKRALGPWYQLVDGTGTGAAGYYSVELPIGVQPSSASSSNGNSSDSSPEASTRPEVTSAYRHSISSPATAIPSVDLLASFFPSDSEEFETVRGPAPTRSHRTSSNMDSHVIGSFHSHHAYTQSPMIAPLNLSTTLEGSLHGLRESVVGLAASVDSMGRRHEMALTNETARMAEEVGGLRAGLHGLRMQVGYFCSGSLFQSLLTLLDPCNHDGPECTTYWT
jgi:hypothetical protein